jgi:hypothetical protein
MPEGITVQMSGSLCNMPAMPMTIHITTISINRRHHNS